MTPDLMTHDLMTRWRAWLAAAALAAPMLGTVAACTSPQMAASTAGSVAGLAGASERGFARGLEDYNLWLAVNRAWIESDAAILAQVNLQVHEGRALLTGEAANAEERTRIETLARSVGGLREVIDDITVPSVGTVASRLRDEWIVRQLDARLLLDEKIQAINFSLEASNGVVYLIGIARSPEELERVVNHARDIAYVRRVASHVRVEEPGAP
jgi:osmotically-inducible protein OsmY